MVGYLKGFVKARKTPFENLVRNYSNVTIVRGLRPDRRSAVIKRYIGSIYSGV